MPKLYSSKHIIKILESKGFFLVSQKGSHLKYRKTGKNTFTAIIPHPKKEIPFGTFRSILRQASLTEADFENQKIAKTNLKNYEIRNYHPFKRR